MAVAFLDVIATSKTLIQTTITITTTLIQEDINNNDHHQKRTTSSHLQTNQRDIINPMTFSSLQISILIIQSMFQCHKRTKIEMATSNRTLNIKKDTDIQSPPGNSISCTPNRNLITELCRKLRHN